MNANLNPTPKAVTNEVIDLDLSVTKKKKFRFDKDDKRILELNVSDMTILGRISETYPKLNELNEKAGSRFRLLVYEKDFNTPESFGKGVMYQIFTDRFF